MPQELAANGVAPAAHIVPAAETGHWLPDDGYVWVVNPPVPGDFRVRWEPGRLSAQHPHVVAAVAEGRWLSEDGYIWMVNPPPPGDFSVRWNPGRLPRMSEPTPTLYQLPPSLVFHLLAAFEILGETGRIDRLVGLGPDDVANLAAELAGQIGGGAGGNELTPRFPANAVSREVARSRLALAVPRRHPDHPAGRPRRALPAQAARRRGDELWMGDSADTYAW